MNPEGERYCAFFLEKMNVTKIQRQMSPKNEEKNELINVNCTNDTDLFQDI